MSENRYSEEGPSQDDFRDSIESDEIVNNEIHEEEINFIPKDTDIGRIIPNYLVASKKELFGFYSIGASNMPYSLIGLAVAIPLLLEGFAAKAGTLMDGITPCDTTKKGYQCIVSILGIKVESSTFSLFTMALSVLLQAVLFIGLSSLADYGNYRKSLLIFSSLIAIITMFVLALIKNSDLYWFIALLSVVTNVAYGVSTVFFYAYITTLTRYHPKTVAARAIGDDLHYYKVKDQVGNEISSKASIYGFISTLIAMIVCGTIIYYHDDLVGLQMCCLIVSGIWLVGLFLQILYLRRRDGPPLPKDKNVILFSLSEIYGTIKQVRKMPNTFKYLLSWMLLSDAASSIGTVGILFSKIELQMDIKELFFMVVIIVISGILGIYVWNFIQRIFNIKTINMLIMITLLFTLMPLYGIIGIFNSHIGLHYKIEVILFSGFHGFLSGALNSYSRVQFSELIPPNRENQFFGLYEITDNGSSWIGPMVIGIISHYSHNLRYGFLFIVPMLLLSCLCLYLVDVEKGIQQANSFAKEETYLELNQVEHNLWSHEDNDPDFYKPNNNTISNNINNMNSISDSSNNNPWKDEP